MALENQPATLNGEALPEAVRLQAKRAEGTPATLTRVARAEHLRKEARCAFKSSKADRCLDMLKACGPGTVGDIAANLAALAGGLGLASDEVRARVNSLHRRGLVIDTGHRRAGLTGAEATIWAAHPEVDVKSGEAADAPPPRLSITREGRQVSLYLTRPRVSDGAYRPTKEGFDLDVGSLPSVIAGLQQIEADARARGLIGGGT